MQKQNFFILKIVKEILSLRLIIVIPVEWVEGIIMAKIMDGFIVGMSPIM